MRGTQRSTIQRLAIEWDPATPMEFRSALESALADFLIETFDVSEVEGDPEAPPAAKLRVWASDAPVRSEPGVLAIACGAGSGGASMPRLDESDIANISARWLGVLRRLGDLMDRPGLAAFAETRGDPDAMKAWALSFPGDPLAQDIGVSLRTDVLLARAASADAERTQLLRERQQSDRAHDEAVRLGRLAALHAQQLAEDKSKLEVEVQRLREEAEDGPYPLGVLDPEVRELVSLARAAAMRARQAAAGADGAAKTRTGARTWTSTRAVYDGETRNDLPDGLGVMWFGSGKERFAGYRGEFFEGRRQGVGIGCDAGGSIWSGEWRDDEACGLGVLETIDGRRFEGRVRAGPQGPERQDGWVWPTLSKRPRDIGDDLGHNGGTIRVHDRPRIGRSKD